MFYFYLSEFSVIILSICEKSPLLRQKETRDLWTFQGGILMKVNEKTYLSIEEIISLPTLSSTNISDDGKNVAFVKKTADWKDNTYRNHVWIYEKDKKQSSQLSNGDIDSTHPYGLQMLGVSHILVQLVMGKIRYLLSH